MHDGPTFAELKGKRLGAVERGILLSAASPGRSGPLLSEGSLGQALRAGRRPAGRLEAGGPAADPDGEGHGRNEGL